MSSAQELAYRFASKGDRFGGTGHEPGLDGVPVLHGALAHVQCRVAETVTGGTHTVFLAHVAAAAGHEGAPLTYFRGRFGRLESARPTLDALNVPEGVPIVTRDQVGHAKPDPDLFLAAAERLGVRIEDSVVVGDSVWDLLAARRARALGVGLLSGGYGQEELERAGAYRVYQDPADLLRHLDEVGVRAAV